MTLYRLTQLFHSRFSSILRFLQLVFLRLSTLLHLFQLPSQLLHFSLILILCLTQFILLRFITLLRLFQLLSHLLLFLLILILHFIQFSLLRFTTLQQLLYSLSHRGLLGFTHTFHFTHLLIQFLHSRFSSILRLFQFLSYLLHLLLIHILRFLQLILLLFTILLRLLQLLSQFIHLLFIHTLHFIQLILPLFSTLLCLLQLPSQLLHSGHALLVLRLQLAQIQHSLRHHLLRVLAVLAAQRLCRHAAQHQLLLLHRLLLQSSHTRLQPALPNHSLSTVRTAFCCSDSFSSVNAFTRFFYSISMQRQSNFVFHLLFLVDENCLHLPQSRHYASNSSSAVCPCCSRRPPASSSSPSTHYVHSISLRSDPGVP